MKIKALNNLAQFGIKAYKDTVLEVDSKTGEELVKKGFAEEIKKPKKDKV